MQQCHRYGPVRGGEASLRPYRDLRIVPRRRAWQAPIAGLAGNRPPGRAVGGIYRPLRRLISVLRQAVMGAQGP